MDETKDKSGLSRRSVLKVAGGLAGGAMASGLGAPAVRAQGTKTIRFLNTETSIDSIRALKVAAAEYERQFGTKVVIDSVPLDGVFTKVTTSLRGGTPYDIATFAFVGHVLILASEGHLMPLNELTDRYKWGPNILFPIDGKVFWYPYDYNLAWIYYRKDLYEKNGLSVPKTWDAFLANAQKLNGDGRSGALFPIGSNGATNWLSPGFMWAEGVKIFDDKWNIVFDSPEIGPKVAKYLDFFGELYKTMPSGTSQVSFGEVLSNFTGDKVAHTAYAGRLIETLERNAPKLADQYGIMPYMDSAGKAQAVNHGYDGWVVLKTPQADEAMKFMKWFTDNQYINFLHTAPLHFQPPRLDVYDDARWRAHPLIEKHNAAVEEMRRFLTDKNIVLTSIDTQGPKPDLRPGKIFEAFVFPEMLQNKCLKGMASAEAVKIAAERMKQVIA
ncbi:extracellular solute-binding protein [Xanthobacter dioxanivorans]|uniref:Extracellular solute-binding protein n=1 Tax=Xanthobacter dioxanivorans TaxID=2528964 RepID=A0A974SID0_9HYPH|nr:extracellular solute-binding protein [Xanthobacter dioxanivorans]QRG06322.1 extracellular solute-binding protein [Xanthobacter dioxanivorans]